jgi:uncharacterized protein
MFKHLSLGLLLLSAHLVPLLAVQDANMEAIRVDRDTLMYGIQEGSWALIKVFISEGMDINFHYTITTIFRENYLTPLIFAVKLGHKEIVFALIEAGADVNAQDSTGFTALMYAALSENQEIVRLLKQAGADSKIANNSGETAIAYTYKPMIKKLISSND